MQKFKIIFLIIFSVFFASCEKDITIDLPADSERIVIEGRIEENQPPFVIITESSKFFGEANLLALQNAIIDDAQVFVSDGEKEVELKVFCSTDPDIIPLLPALAASFGIPLDLLQSIRYCIYADPTFSMRGIAGKTYNLKVLHNNKTYTSSTTIFNGVPLDKMVYSPDPLRDGFGYLKVTLSEPAGLGNAYRFFVKRITKDSRFLASLGSAFEDKFIDGKTFDFEAIRPQEPQSTKPDDIGPGRFRYLPDDTVVVRLASIDLGVFNFFRTFETEVSNNGNPFSAPITIQTNIRGGALGVWAGYGIWQDTVYLGQ